VKLSRVHLPLVVALLLCGALFAYGPIVQPAHYHEFADQSVLMGIPHGADVWSNAGFACLGAWGMLRLWPVRHEDFLKNQWPGYSLFLIGLMLTAIGSSFYHLAPDNFWLVWDRLPISLTCAGLLAAVRAESVANADCSRDTILLAILAVAGVGWWYVTDQRGMGDLRPYLLLQALTLTLIPLWQTIYHAPARDRVAFGVAVLLYLVAKVTELQDQEVLAALGVMTGHTLKHLLSAAAAAVIVTRLVSRARERQSITRARARSLSC
jgi:hypothetical protein